MREIDLDLEAAVAEFRRLSSRIPHGQVTLFTERHAGLVTSFACRHEEYTNHDLESIMQSKPNKGAK